MRGLISEDVGLRLCTLARSVAPEHAIVEVGAFCGKSTSYLATGAKLGAGAHVWTFDAWDLPGNEPGWHPTEHGFNRAFELFEKHVRALDLSSQVTAERAFSVDAAKTWKRPVGLLFVDGSHLYADVAADFAAWSAHLAPGAVVAFDDYNTPRNPGVTRFVNELVRSLDGWSWGYRPWPLAIGVKPCG